MELNQRQIDQEAWDLFCAAPTLREGVQRVVAYMQRPHAETGDAQPLTDAEWAQIFADLTLYPMSGMGKGQNFITVRQTINAVLAQRALPAEAQGEIFDCRCYDCEYKWASVGEPERCPNCGTVGTFEFHHAAQPTEASSDGPGDARCNQIKGLEQCVFKPGHAHDHKTVSGETWRNFYRPFVYEEAQPVQDGESRTVVPKEALAAAIELMRKWKGYPHPDSIENTALIRSTTGILEAALSVARPAILAEALAEIKIGEWGEIGRTDPPRSNGLERANRLLADRLRRLTHPPEPAARVSTHFNGTTDKFEVWLDGKMKWDHADNMAVRAMASGLIEELEAARQKAGAE